MRGARRNNSLFSSLNALHLVAVGESANKPIGGVTKAESEQSDPLLLQNRGTWQVLCFGKVGTAV